MKLRFQILVYLLLIVTTVYAKSYSKNIFSGNCNVLNSVETEGICCTQGLGSQSNAIFAQSSSNITDVSSTVALIGAPIPSSCGILTIPIKVNNFSNVGAVSLKLNFDATILAFENIDGLVPELAESFFHADNTQGQFVLSYYGNGFSLPDESILFRLNFKTSTLGGTTSISWNNEIYSENCEFAGPGGNPIYSGSFVGREIQLPSKLVATAVVESILCNGGTTIVNVSATGGTAPYSGCGEFTVSAGNHSFTVTDANGCTDEVKVAVDQPDTSILQINTFEVTPISPIEPGSIVELTIDFDADNPVDISVDWGSGTTQNLNNKEDGILSLSHFYENPGVYTLNISLTDICGKTVFKKYEYVVVYDSDAGFVTGGGWIISPPGAYLADESLTGKANFSFVSKYHNGKTVPFGNTVFHFQTAGLNFKSTSYDWLVVSGTTKAQFMGNGTINRLGNYGLKLTAFDGLKKGKDKIRIEIWDKDNNNKIVYDNLVETEIGSGSIVIHTSKNKSLGMVTSLNSPMGSGQMELNVYPNPFTDRLNIQFIPNTNTHARFELFNTTGNLIQTIFDENVIKGTFIDLEYIPNFQLSQMLIYRLTISNDTRMGKVIFNHRE